MLICDKEKKEEKKGEGSSDSAEEIEGGLKIKPCLRTFHLNNEIDKKVGQLVTGTTDFFK